MLVATVVDVGRLVNELETVDETLMQLELKGGGKEAKLPKTSRLLDQTVEFNKLNLLHPEDRRRLLDFLTEVREKAPVLHMSFGADPSPAFVEKLMAWLRREIHPVLLLSLGLQPSIGAGCIVRGNSKYFDFSLQQDFVKKRDLLLTGLREAGA
jgi:F0F1-type ATP synthase delta subunit